MSWPARIGLGVLALVLALFAGGAALLTLISPTDLVRDQIVAQVRDQTGRNLTIAGGASLEYWPSLGVALHGVALAPPDGMAAPDTLRADKLAAHLAILPLLSGRAVVQKVVLVAPDVDLRLARDGTTSWQIRKAAARKGQTTRPSIRYAGTPEISSAGFLAAPSSGLLDRLELNAVEIEDGRLTYTDERSGLVERVGAINMELTGKGIADPVSFNGAARVRGQDLQFNGGMSKPNALMEGASSDTRLTVTSNTASLSFQGDASLKDGLSLQGPASLRAGDLAAAARIARANAPQLSRLGALALDAQLKLSTSRRTTARLSGLSLTLGQMKARGSVDVTVAERPSITADLTVNRIDVDKILAALPSDNAADTTRAGPNGAARPRARETDGSPSSIKDLLRGSDAQQDQKSQVRGYTARDGWSTMPLPLDALKAVDVRAKLRSGPVVAKTLRIDSALVRLTLKNGAGRADLDDIRLYDGKAAGFALLTPARSGASLKANVQLERIAVRKLLTQLAETGSLSGTGNARFAITANGQSQHDVMTSLAGTTAIEVANGAIVGWNVAELVRGLQRGRLDGLSRNPDKVTDFSSLNATFNLTNGVAQNNDLRLVAPLIRAGGEGKIDIGRRRVDYLVRPTLVASLQGQGASATQDGLQLPFRIKGPWADPEIIPDVTAVLGNSKQIEDTAKRVVDEVDNLKKQFKGRKTEEVIGDLLRDDGAKAKDLLDGLLGR